MPSAKARAKLPVVILASIRWDFLWQGQQILATLFARAGYPTVYVETTGIRNLSLDPGTVGKVVRRVLRSHGKGHAAPDSSPNLTVYSPLVAPPTLKIFRKINRRLFVPRIVRDLHDLTGPEPLVIVYPPTRTTLQILSELKPRLTMYNCYDNYEGFPGVPRDIAATERELLERADFVSCASAFMLEKIKPIRPDTSLIGPGVDYKHFEVLQETGFSEQVRTVSFFGHLSEERLDFPILRGLAEAGFNVRLVGGLGRLDKSFLRTPGIDHRAEVPHAKLPAVLAGTDAFIIPYRINDLTRGIFPAKIYECLATGKPVVSTPLPEMERFGEHIYLAKNAQEFVQVLGRLPQLETQQKVRARIELARENSWEARFAGIEEALWRKLQESSE